MASEYLKWLYRDVKPDPPPPPLTGKKKLLNWLHYHKVLLAVVAVLLWIGGSITWSLLGIGQTKPDYIVAYIGKEELPKEAVSAFETALAGLGTDVNGDGKVAVELRQYAMERKGDAETTLYYNTAANTLLLADITAKDSYIFLAEDPEAVQRAWQLYAKEDGTPPDDDDYGAADKVYRWSDCPVLCALDMDQSAFGSLSVGRRCFYGNDGDGREADEDFWLCLVEGAKR